MSSGGPDATLHYRGSQLAVPAFGGVQGQEAPALRGARFSRRLKGSSPGVLIGRASSPHHSRLEARRGGAFTEQSGSLRIIHDGEAYLMPSVECFTNQPGRNAQVWVPEPAVI